MMAADDSSHNDYYDDDKGKGKWVEEEEAKLRLAEQFDGEDDDDSLFTDSDDYEMESEEDNDDDGVEAEMVIEDPFRKDLPAHGALLDLTAEPAETPCKLSSLNF